MMLFIMLSLPGAIALYYFISNVVGFIQQSLILKKDEEELEQLADEPDKKSGKKATAKARAKVATEAKVTNVTRITAQDNRKGK